MATGKTSTLTIRLEPDLKEALRAAASLEHRSIANMVEVMILDHCSRSGIPVKPGLAATAKPPRAAARPKGT